MKKLLSLVLTAIILLTAVSTAYADGNSYKMGDIIQFGSYPQSEVKDENLINALNDAAADWDEWTSYGYYAGADAVGTMQQGDWMRYTDVTYEDVSYRGVRFESYRPYYTFSASDENTYQDDNGYLVDETYWFEYEALNWRVLDPAKGFVMCETIIDSQPYNNTIYYKSEKYFSDAACEVSAIDYAGSSIRKWLNEDFYNTAFTADEQEKIALTEISNFGYHTANGYNGYGQFDSEATKDKIFLLSCTDIVNDKYGFSSSDATEDKVRREQGSDYAKSQGLWVFDSTGSYFDGNSNWLLRTAANKTHLSCNISIYGDINKACYVYYTNNGIRPAMNFIDISSVADHDHAIEEKITTPATHLAEGEKSYICRCCGDTTTELLPKIEEHTYAEVITYPTCSSTGFKTYTCDCGDSYVSGNLPAVEHKDDDKDNMCDYGCGYDFTKDADSESTIVAFFKNIIKVIKSILAKIFG